PFGPRTNVLQGPPSSVVAAPSRCAPGTGFMTTAAAGVASPYVCAKPSGDVTFYSATSRPLGASEPVVFSNTPRPGTLVDAVQSAIGSVDVVALGGPLFV